MLEDWFIPTSFILTRMPRVCAKEKFDKKVFTQKELRYKESLPCSRTTYAATCLGMNHALKTSTVI